MRELVDSAADDLRVVVECCGEVHPTTSTAASRSRNGELFIKDDTAAQGQPDAFSLVGANGKPTRYRLRLCFRRVAQ